MKLSLPGRGCGLAAAIGSFILASPAWASSGGGLSGVMDNIKRNLGSVTDVIGVVAFIAGIGFGFMGAVKLRQAHNSHQPGALHEGLILIGVAALCIGLPMLLGVGITSIFGSSSNLVSATGTLQSITGQ